jgi:hypothetical protein
MEKHNGVSDLNLKRLLDLSDLSKELKIPIPKSVTEEIDRLKAKLERLLLE